MKETRGDEDRARGLPESITACRETPSGLRLHVQDRFRSRSVDLVGINGPEAKGHHDEKANHEGSE